MKLFLTIILYFYLILFNIHSIASEEQFDQDKIKIGVLVPLSGENKEIGISILNSIRMAITKIDDKKIEIYPKDNGSNPKLTFIGAKQLESEGVNLVIGPVFHKNLTNLDKIQNLTFVSLTNKTKNIPNNVLNLGIDASSQINTIIDFLKKKNLKKTIFLIPKTNYESEIRNAIMKTNYKFSKIYSYDIDPTKLTSQIQQISSFDQRKRNLETRIRILENSDDYSNKKELKKLEKMHTLGNVNFDSVIVAGFDENLKSVINSFLFSDVSSEKVKFIVLNQWFDSSFFKEDSLNKIYFPSIGYSNFEAYRKSYYKKFGIHPVNISILSYDAFGLSYFFLKKDRENIKKNLLNKKNTYLGKIGKFSIENKKTIHNLSMYQILDQKFKLK
jgi:hypothetical protein